jgi:hypothetical protein
MRWAAHLLACAATAAGCSTQRVPQFNPVDRGHEPPVCDGGPLLAVTPQVIDFGGVVAFTSTTQVVAVTSCSNEDLTLTPSIGGSQAGLFSVDRPEGVAFSVPANGSVALKVSYAPVDVLAAAPLDTAILTLADENGGKLVVSLQGSALPSGLTFSPDGIAFDILAPGDSETLSTRLTNMGRTAVIVPPLSILNVSSPPGFALAADSWSGGALGAGEGRDVRVTYAPPAFNNIYMAEVTVGSDLLDSLPLFGEVAAPIPPAMSCAIESCTWCPLELDFGWVSLATSKMLSLSCQNTSVPDLILGFSTDDPAFTAMVDPASPSPASAAQPLKSGETVTIDVIYAPPLPVADEGTVTITTNRLPVGASVTVTGVGFTTELGPCELEVTPADGIGLGLVEVGASADGGFVVTNVGTHECLVNTFAIASDCTQAFGITNSVAGQRLSTDGGGDDYPNSLIIPVSLTPSDAGLYSCYFNIDLDAGQPPFAAYVWGRGVAD